MPYPRSPFKVNFDTSFLLKFNNCNLAQIQNELNLEGLLRWLCSTPKVTTYRVNTLTHTVDQVYDILKSKLTEISCTATIDKHATLNELILIHHKDNVDLNTTDAEKEVIIDSECAASVLRGSHIYAPGVMAMMSGTKPNEKVKVYADAAKNCRRGFSQLYEDPDKVLIAVGNAEMVRYQLFGENLKPVGVAVRITETASGCPILGNNCLPRGAALLQNLPSIACVHALNPKPGDTVLDMCASPGNKTTHIAALMNNEGTLIAIDKTPKKISRLKETCATFGAKVHFIQADSSNIVGEELKQCSDVLNGAPFPEESFDKILLDAPCSALGKRPQFSNNINIKLLRSFIPLQRKLFYSAVKLLRPGGTLVYSTCTITVGENEGMVAWALKTFDCLQLIKAEPHIGGKGVSVEGLTEEQQHLVQRFGPEQELDSVGFFIACFTKR